MELYANRLSLENIELHDKSPHPFYKHIDKYIKVKIEKPWYKQLFSKTEYVEKYVKGFLDTFWPENITDEYLNRIHLYTDDEIYKKGYIVSDSSEIEPKVYNKPYIKLIFNSGKEYYKKFDSYEELMVFAQPIINKNKDIVKFM